MKGKGGCIFRSCCGVGRGMRCFPGSRRGDWQSCDVGRKRGTLHAEITRQQSRRGVRWTCLCYLIACSRNNVLCAELKGFWILATTTCCLASTTFPREALFCVKMATIHTLNIAKPPLACRPVIYIYPLLWPQTVQHNARCELLNRLL